jgi:hypothetical protein
MKSIGAFLLAVAWAGCANAQTDAATPCPAASGDFHWTEMLAGQLWLCRAIDDQGEELFALTIVRDSPFRPQRSNRAETGVLGGVELQWYRTELSPPNEFVREALIEIDRNRKMHIVLRAPDAETMARRQRMVETLELQAAGVANR